MVLMQYATNNSIKRTLEQYIVGINIEDLMN